LGQLLRWRVARGRAVAAEVARLEGLIQAAEGGTAAGATSVT
jgi:hypothetical protein